MSSASPPKNYQSHGNLRKLAKATAKSKRAYGVMDFTVPGNRSIISVIPYGKPFVQSPLIFHSLVFTSETFSVSSHICAVTEKTFSIAIENLDDETVSGQIMWEAFVN